MAKITLSKLAPQEKLSASFAGGAFDLAPGETYETDDRRVLGEAAAHDWFDVELDPVEAYTATNIKTLSPADDYLSYENGLFALDPEEVRKAEEAKGTSDAVPVAIDTGLKQSTVKSVGKGDHRTATTFAADDKFNADDSADAGQEN